MKKSKNDTQTDSSYTIETEFFTDIVPPDVENVIKELYENNPELKQQSIEEIQNWNDKQNKYLTGRDAPVIGSGWIQTYSGLKFDPINPYPGAIVIQDIAHALSMQCRFSGHVKDFCSVAQHSVGVSYLCDEADAMSGLLHDASEAYLVDIPSPLKRSDKFEVYRELEKNMQKVICKRFELPEEEPKSVKIADQKMLAMEARDLMSPLHPDWSHSANPLPFKIVPLSPQDAKKAFMKRFFELLGCPEYYDHYLDQMI